MGRTRNGSSTFGKRFPTSRRPLTIERLAPQPRSRSFIVGSTGSGKSTLAASLLEAYSRLHPRHVLYLIDPKHRFVPVELDDDEEPYAGIFPNGYRESNFGRRDGVAVLADTLTRPKTPGPQDRVFVVQDEDTQHELFAWLYPHATVQRPSLLYLDETFDLMRGTRADPAFRRLMQQGREIGVGAVVVNQRPAWIDATFLTESDQLYIGSLNHPADRERMAEIVADQTVRDRVESWLPRHHWIYVDQHKPESRLFTLRGV